MFRRHLISLCILLSLPAASCLDLKSNDDAGVDHDIPSFGRFEIIDGTTDGSCCHPRESNIGFDDQGNAIVVMLKGYEIWVNRYEVGKGWGTAERLDPGPVSNFPEIAVAGNGNALVAWAHVVNSTTDYYYTRHFDPDTGWGPLVRLNSADGLQSRSASISVDAVENYHIIWEQVVWGYSTGSGSIWSRKFSPLTGWQPEEVISTGTGASSHATVRVNAAGQGFAVWGHQKTAGATFLLNSARYDPLTGWDAPVEFATDTAGSAMTLSGRTRQFTVDADGEGIFTWLHDQDPGSSSDYYDIFVNQYTTALGWGAPQLLPLTDPGQRGEGSHLGITGDGTTIHVWNEDWYPSVETWYRLYNKSIGWTARQRIYALNGDEYVTNLSANKQGNAVVQWSSYVNGKTRIYISRCSNGAWSTREEVDVGTISVPTTVKTVLDDQNMITITFDGLAARVPF